MNCCYDVTEEIAVAVQRYVERGGNVLWLNGAISEKTPQLASVFGIKPGYDDVPTRCGPLTRQDHHPLAGYVPGDESLGPGVTPSGINGGVVVACFETGQPAIVANQYGSGNTVIVGFNVSKAGTEDCVQMMRGILQWFRTESGVKAKGDPLAVKRAEWVQWRADQITNLVRSVRGTVNSSDSQLEVSVAGGFDSSEKFTCFRDGKKWLDEGLLDFGIPMDYCENVKSLEKRLDSHRAIVSDKERRIIYPGLSLYVREVLDGKKTALPKDPGILKQELDLLEERGFRGYALFCSDQLTEDLVKAIAQANQ